MNIRYCGAGSLSRSEETSSGGMHLSCHEILYITTGRAVFSWRGNTCEAEAPAVFILPPSTPHELESGYGEIRYCFVELDKWNDFPLSDEQVDHWNFMQSQNDVYAKTLAASSIILSIEFVYAMHSTGNAPRNSNLEEACLLEIRKIYKLIAHVVIESGDEPAYWERKDKRKSRAAVDLMIDYMDTRYKEDITLEELAQSVYLHPSYVVRLFKKHKGMTPFEYLRDLRLRAAASYLSGSDMPISDIVQKTGFNSLHYFTRMFSSHYGQSPAEWRRQIRSRSKSAPMANAESPSC
ncbi:AraC family transcriptional regulator [Paenibacillus sp. J5C_2022]|uniref:AraC family transcriptional regulator n=1 Tax=Paenibacillus sp. J5C2022 TaxID=2977129 RepID=UPI0021D38048|nr:AraC family transcriptional regulator [Paenibacillus sp. J5C2022]MCU6708570.1 AraC family transcriptional regulator [Paenibacillus sp. J5C2022]